MIYLLLQYTEQEERPEMKLYLDDYRTPPRDAGYISASNYADFLTLLDTYRYCIELADLDYDLGYGVTLLLHNDLNTENILLLWINGKLWEGE